MIKIQVGNSFKIIAQLHDGSTERSVFCNITNEKDETLARARMSAGAKGLYFLDYEMPECEFLTAQIEVDGLDNIGQPYAMASNTYYSKPMEEKYVTGEVTGFFKSDDIITGVAHEAKNLK